MQQMHKPLPVKEQKKGNILGDLMHWNISHLLKDSFQLEGGHFGQM